eukprot:m.47082 g.47082  ORF g.47082 m.47082 type:complete len:143 (+) comp15199_c0_seq1:176-604(+)
MLRTSLRRLSTAAGTVSANGMKLLTHNMMQSHVKGVRNGYPLNVKATEMKEIEVDFNPEFISRMLPRIEFEALRKTTAQLGMPDALPVAVPMDAADNEDFLKQLHHVLLEVVVVQGELECPESGTKFPIRNGIPNMLLPEDA